MLGGIGFDLGPVERHVPQLHEPGLLAEPQHLHEQGPQRLEMPLPERGEAVMVGMLVRGQHPIRHVLVRRPLDLPRRRLARAVRVDQELDHHPRVVRRLPALFALVGGEDRREIQRLHHVAHEQGQVALGQPLAHVRRQQQPLV